jgi:hypothetical protein
MSVDAGHCGTGAREEGPETAWLAFHVAPDLERVSLSANHPAAPNASLIGGHCVERYHRRHQDALKGPAPNGNVLRPARFVRLA